MKLSKIVLAEGGNVQFNVDGKEIKGGRIHLHDITDTLEYVSEITGISVQKLWDGLLGSGGKETTSGDLDIALSPEDYNFEEFNDHMKTTYDHVTTLPGLKTVNLLIPIQGHASKKIDGFNGWVQVDFFFGNKDWLKFSHFSAGRKSKYKGMYRTVLLMSVVAARTRFADYDDQGELLAKVGEIFDLNKGIVTQYRMRTRRKEGEGYVKSLKPVNTDDQEWIERYGEQEHEIKEISNPKEAAEYLFGPGTKPSDLSTFEKVKKLVKGLPKKEQLLINKLFIMRTGYPIDEAPTKKELISERTETVMYSNFGHSVLVKVAVDPSPNQIRAMISKDKYNQLRASFENDEMFVWKATEMLHHKGEEKLGLSENNRFMIFYAEELRQSEMDLMGLNLQDNDIVMLYLYKDVPDDITNSKYIERNFDQSTTLKGYFKLK